MVDASIVARLLGLRLLRLNAHITIVPAELERATPDVQFTPRFGGRLSDAENLVSRAAGTLHESRRELAGISALDTRRK